MAELGTSLGSVDAGSNVGTNAGTTVGTNAGTNTASTCSSPEPYPRVTPKRHTLVRSLGAWTLAVLACLAIPLSVVAWWAVTSVESESQYVSMLAPLARDQAVMSSVTDNVTNVLLTQSNRGPVPLPTAQLRPTVRASVARVVAGPSFPGIWTAAVRASHPAVLSLLTGRTGSEGPVVLNLTPVVSAVVSELQGQGIAAAPVLATNKPPQAVIKLVPTSKVSSASQVFHDVVGLERALAIVAAVALVGALLLAPRRRSVLLGLMVGTALVSVAIIGLLAAGRAAAVKNTHQGGSTNATSVAVFDALARYLRVDLYLLLAAAAAIALGVVAWWAVTSRRRRSIASGTVV